MRPKTASNKERSGLVPHARAEANRDEGAPRFEDPNSKIVAIDADRRLAHLNSSAEDLLANGGAEEIEGAPPPSPPPLPITLYAAHPESLQTTWVDGNVEALTGFRSDRFLTEAHFWASRMHPEDREAVIRALSRVGEKEVVTVQYRWQCADGAYRWFSDRAALIREGAGRTAAIRGSWTDITQLKRMEDEKDLFVSLAESSEEFICLADVEGRPFFLNKAGRKLIGINESDQMDSINLSNLCTLATWSSIRDYALPSALADRRWEGEGQLCGVNGNAVDVHISTIPIKNHWNEEPLRVAVLTRDITERKRASAALLESKARLELINGIASELRSAAPVDRIIERTLEMISSRFPSMRIAFFAIGESGMVVTARSIQPEGMQPLSNLPEKLGGSESFLQSLRSGQPVVDEGFTPGMYARDKTSVFKSGKGALLAAPLIHSGELIGALCCDTPENRKWKDGEIATLKEAAEYLTIAIVETRRHEEHERTEEEVRERDSIIRGFYDSSPLMMGVVELVGDDILHVADNAATGKFFERTARALSGELSSSLGFPKEYRNLWIRRYRESERTGAPVRFEYRHPAEAGERALSTTVCFLSRTPAGRSRFSYVVEDVTDRKQALEALHETERLVQRIAETAPNLIYIYDIVERRNVYANRGLAQVLGYEQGEIDEIGPALTSTIMHPDDVDGVCSHYTRLERAKEGEVYWAEYRLRRADGKWRWYQSWESIFRHDETGRALQIIGSALDITERRQAEEALREMETFTRRVTEATPDVICICDIEAQRPVYLTGQTIASLGYSVEDTLARGYGELRVLFHDDDRAALVEHITRLLDAKDAEVCEIDNRLKRYDGEWRWFRWRNTVFTRRPDGKPLQLLCLGQDITERKRADEQLREQAALLDHAQDAIMVRDMQSRVMYWNQSAERLYGCSAEEAAYKPVHELIPKGHSPRFEEAIQSLADRGEWQGQLKQITRSGQKIVVESRWTLVRDEYGKPKTILVINTDITEKKRLEAQFLRAQRMESIGTLAGGIAHDLNNVLSPILMAIQMLQTRFTDDESQRLLLILRKSAERGADMVSQVLSFARGLEGERVNLNPRHLVKEIVKMLRNTLPKAIDISFNVGEDLWPVAGDATQLYQVLMNLCVNSRDAMPDGGRLVITAENVRLEQESGSSPGLAKPSRYVKIKVADTGLGIPPENLDKIFDPFFTTKRLGEGTGLGLSTVAGIVKGHGGFMSVTSEVGRGSQFDIYLPATPAQKGKAGGEEGMSIPIGHGEVVLVVDDEVAIQEITRETLEAYGYRVIVASDGAEAVGIYALNKEKIKVVLLDMMMPYMDGPATIRSLRQLDPKVRIMVVSGLAGDDKIAELTTCGIKTILSKPYTAARLLDALAGEIAD